MDTHHGESAAPQGAKSDLDKKREVLERARADHAIKGQPTGGVDTTRDTPAGDEVARPQGATNETR
jgi:hypothetical protein